MMWVSYPITKNSDVRVYQPLGEYLAGTALAYLILAWLVYEYWPVIVAMLVMWTLVRLGFERGRNWLLRRLS